MIVSSPPCKVDECIGKPQRRMQGSNVTLSARFSVTTMMQGLRKSLEPALRRFLHLYWRFARGMTLGVRAVVLDAENRVFLVKHSYVSGWHLPGGGVEVGETLRQALQRELAEEGRIELVGEPALHGIYLNSHVSRRDHVAVYLVRHFRQDRLPEPNREIIDCGFFETQALPVDATIGTRLRISEVIENRPPIPTWR
jgi:8-oxo-dGTP pyrophosphatase MutT (NUDIX family)